MLQFPYTRKQMSYMRAAGLLFCVVWSIGMIYLN